MWREYGLTVTFLVLGATAVACLIRAWVVQAKMEAWKGRLAYLANALEREKYADEIHEYHAGVNTGLEVAVRLVKRYLEGWK